MPSKLALVTGAAGFIGFHLSQKLLAQGYSVVGLDNLNAYYDVSLKESRLKILMRQSGFIFVKGNLHDYAFIEKTFSDFKFDYVVNLAAQAGLRYSIQNPHAYIESNVQGFLNILEGCRHHRPTHLVYASSSSVYGANKMMPFSVHQNVDHPISLYAATKKSNEMMAHAYSVLYKIPTTGLRFFNVYGPYGRPDMALFIFTKSILDSKPIDVFNHGRMKRDFTYVDDIVEGISRLIPKVAESNSQWNPFDPDPATSFAPFRLYNIGNTKPVELMYYIEILEQKLGRVAVKNLLPMQDGEVAETYSDVGDLIHDVGFKPSTPIEVGIGKFVDWYLDYYQIKK
jgi:UDP-glucuronate 4-epimerase